MISMPVQVLGDDRAAEQAFYDAAVLFVVRDQLRRHAEATGHRQHLALRRREHAPAYARQRQERRPSVAILAQVGDHILGDVFILCDDVLQRAAQHRFDRALVFLGRVDQGGHDAVYPALLISVEQHLLDRMLIALVVALHLPQHAQARREALLLSAQLLQPRLERFAPLAVGAHLGVQALRLLLQRPEPAVYSGQRVLCALQRLRKAGLLRLHVAVL